MNCVNGHIPKHVLIVPKLLLESTWISDPYFLKLFTPTPDSSIRAVAEIIFSAESPAEDVDVIELPDELALQMMSTYSKGDARNLQG